MKTRNLTQSRTWNDPINRRMHGYSFFDFEDEDGVQDVISPSSLDQFLISNTLWTWKGVKNVKKSNDTWIVVSRQFDLSRKSKSVLPLRRTVLFIEEKRRNRRIWTSIVINGPDDASFDQNGAIKSHLSDRKWKGEMGPRGARKGCVVSSRSLDLHRMVMVCPRVARWVIKIVT